MEALQDAIPKGWRDDNSVVVEYDSIKGGERVTELMVWAEVGGQRGLVLGEAIFYGLAEGSHDWVAGCSNTNVVPSDRFSDFCWCRKCVSTDGGGMIWYGSPDG